MSRLGGAGAVAQLVADIPISVKVIFFFSDVRPSDYGLLHQ
jgi:hypothetical protein